MRGGWMGPVLTDDQYRAKLKSRCIVTDKGCWEWQGSRKPPPRHYGMTSYHGKPWMTHRLTYFLTKGEIPKGMLVMHSCDNPPCCNPDHLSLGTHLHNMSDCRAKGRYYYANLTHCKRGHEFNEANTYIIQTPGEAFGLRACKVCRTARRRIRSGWPEHLAFSDIKVPRGYTMDFETGKPVRWNKKHAETVCEIR